MVKKRSTHLVGTKGLLIFENYRYFSLIMKQWPNWTDIHYQKPGGICVMDTGRDVLKNSRLMRFSMPQQTSTKNWTATFFAPRTPTILEERKRLFKNFFQKLERKAKKYLASMTNGPV